jgi:biopolymer transport protein ExbB
MEEITLLTVVMKGGVLMIPIALCSIIVIGVALERFFKYRWLKVDTNDFMIRLRQHIMKGDMLSAINECDIKSPVCSVVKAGLEKAGFGRDRMKEAFESAGNTEVYHLEKNLNVLATLAGATPLIGFLGTVTGMIKAFMKIQQLSGNVNADVLAGGIWEAMVTTAAGLVVGIPALILYNYYVNRVRGFVYQMELASEEVMDKMGLAGTAPQTKTPEKPDPFGIEEPQKKPGLAASFDPEDIQSEGGGSL